MTPHRDRPEGNNRWTKEGTTPGEDPREIDEEQADSDQARRLLENRKVTHAEQDTGDELGTSSTTYDPTERH